jgi:hypothetical protein
MEAGEMYEQIKRTGWLRISNDVARLHIKINNLNNLLVGFCFIKSID